MEAVAWTAIGLLAATLAILATALFHLDSNIDALGRDLGARIDAQGRDLGARIDGLGASLGAPIDAQTARIDAHLARHEF
jgi:hypothetical protein